MAFKEHGNYDAVGLAELARTKQVTARELLDEAIVRTAKVDPQKTRSSSSTTTMPSARSSGARPRVGLLRGGGGLREASGALVLGTILVRFHIFHIVP